MSETDELFHNLPDRVLERLAQLPNLKAAYEQSAGCTLAEIWFDKNPLTLEELANGSKPNQISVKPVTASGRKQRTKHDWMTVRRYSSKGNFYYRFVWGLGHSVKGWHHIPGGNWRSPLTRQRRDQVKQWIKEKKSSEWIARQIQLWGF